MAINYLSDLNIESGMPSDITLDSCVMSKVMLVTNDFDFCKLLNKYCEHKN